MPVPGFRFERKDLVSVVLGISRDVSQHFPGTEDDVDHIARSTTLQSETGANPGHGAHLAGDVDQQRGLAIAR